MKKEFRNFGHLLKENGYELKRVRGSHFIYRNEAGRTISINKEPNDMVMRRLIKENHLVAAL